MTATEVISIGSFPGDGLSLCCTCSLKGVTDHLQDRTVFLQGWTDYLQRWTAGLPPGHRKAISILAKRNLSGIHVLRP